MKQYRFWQKIVALFLAGYFVIGFASYGLPNKELFPIFSWLLFAATPGERTAYALRIHSAAGTDFEEPVPHTEALFLMLNATGVSAHNQIQRFGEVFESGDPAAIRDQRAIVEGMFSTQPVRYELVRQVFDPVERWKDHEMQVEVLQQFDLVAPNEEAQP